MTVLGSVGEAGSTQMPIGGIYGSGLVEDEYAVALGDNGSPHVESLMSIRAAQ